MLHGDISVLTVVARRMSAAAFDVSRFSLAFAVRAAILAVGARVALTTGVGALLFFFHG
jgi:hypothetical protein